MPSVTSELLAKKLHHPCGMLDRDQRTTISICRKIRKNQMWTTTTTTNNCFCPSAFNRNFSILANPIENENSIKITKNPCHNFLNVNCCNYYSDLNNNINNFNNPNRNNNNNYKNNYKNNNNNNLNVCEVKKCEENAKINFPITRKDMRNSHFQYTKWALKSHNFLLICICLLTVLSQNSNAAPHAMQPGSKLTINSIEKQCVNEQLEKFIDKISKDYSYFESCYAPFMTDEYNHTVKEKSFEIHKPDNYPNHMLKLNKLYVTGEGCDQVLSHLKNSGPLGYNELKTEIDTIYSYFKTVGYLIEHHLEASKNKSGTKKPKYESCESKYLWTRLHEDSRNFLIMLERFFGKCMNEKFTMDIGRNANIRHFPVVYRAWKVYTEQTKIYIYAVNSLKYLFNRLNGRNSEICQFDETMHDK